MFVHASIYITVVKAVHLDTEPIGNMDGTDTSTLQDKEDNQTMEEQSDTHRMVSFRDDNPAPREGRLGGNIVDCSEEEVFLRRNTRDSRRESEKRPEEATWTGRETATAGSRGGPSDWPMNGRSSRTGGLWEYPPTSSIGAFGDVDIGRDSRTGKDKEPGRNGEEQQYTPTARPRKVPDVPLGLGLNAFPNPPGAGGDGRPIVTPAQYDGTTDLAEFMSHFQLCIRANHWDNATAGMFLGLSLRGNARRLLTSVKAGDAGGFHELVGALEKRFQPRNQAESYKALLRNRDRQADEDLLTYGERLEQLVRLGYPEADAVTWNSLAKDRFLDGLRDSQLRYFILYSQARTLEEAVSVGVRAEAHLAKDRESGKAHRVHATDTTMAGELETLRAEFKTEIGPLRADFMRELALIRKEMEGRRTALTKKGCFHCGVEGHFKRDCPQLMNRPTDRSPTDGRAASADQATSQNERGQGNDGRSPQ